MTPTTPNQAPDGTESSSRGSVADELARESERLRQLADELRAREAEQAEIHANYPYFKQAVYQALREKFMRELPPLPDKDLEALATEEGAMPLESFIQRFEPPPESV